MSMIQTFADRVLRSPLQSMQTCGSYLAERVRRLNYDDRAKIRLLSWDTDYTPIPNNQIRQRSMTDKVRIIKGFDIKIGREFVAISSVTAYASNNQIRQRSMTDKVRIIKGFGITIGQEFVAISSVTAYASPERWRVLERDNTLAQHGIKINEDSFLVSEIGVDPAPSFDERLAAAKKRIIDRQDRYGLRLQS